MRMDIHGRAWNETDEARPPAVEQAPARRSENVRTSHHRRLLHWKVATSYRRSRQTGESRGQECNRVRKWFVLLLPLRSETSRYVQFSETASHHREINGT